jgi:hypothetical protein
MAADGFIRRRVPHSRAGLRLTNDLAVADFNHDGHPDLAIVNTQTPFLTILLGDGHSGFRPAPGSPVRTESSPHPHGVVAGDFAGTGAVDLMTDSWGHNQIELLRGDGRGGFALGPFFNVGKRPYQRLRTALLSGIGCGLTVRRPRRPSSYAKTV